MYVIKQIELATRARLDELFRPIGMTALQYTALTVLERHPGLSSAQLARNSFVTTQSMADMVTALEERGLIERHRDAADRQLRDLSRQPRVRDTGRPQSVQRLRAPRRPVVLGVVVGLIEQPEAQPAQLVSRRRRRLKRKTRRTADQAETTLRDSST